MTTEEKAHAEVICNMDKYMEIVPGMPIEQGINGHTWALFMRENDLNDSMKLSEHWTYSTLNLN